MPTITIIVPPGNGNGGIVPPWLQHGPDTPRIMEMPAPPKPKESNKPWT